jgi:hypothetical protein
MPFRFTCPYCYKVTLVDDALAGQSGPCAGCGKTITIPQRSPQQAPDGVHPIDSPYVDKPSQDRDYRLAGWLLKAIGALILFSVLSAAMIFLFWPVFQDLRARRNKVACMNNLQQIAAALNAYAADYGSYPPPVVYDDQGRPMHSWRVLILDYLGEEALYAQYDMRQPWDSPANAFLFDRCPRVFLSPVSSVNLGSEASYMLITGPGTVFPASGPLGPQQIGDGAENTLLVVEVNNGIHEWTKPIDLNVNALNRRIGAAGPTAIGGNHGGGATAVFADGTGAWLPSDLDPVLLDAITTPNGGEPIDVSEFELR